MIGVVRKNVILICASSFNDGSHFPSATVSVFIRFWLSRSKGRKQIALNIPKAINVQLAPCHMPLTTKMTNILRTFNHVLPLLPPSGIYT